MELSRDILNLWKEICTPWVEALVGPRDGLGVAVEIEVLSLEN
jgi:hypothetical protein